MKGKKVPLKIFLEVKKACTNYWNSCDNLGGYRDKKLSLLNSFDRKDENSVFFMLQMLHPTLRIYLTSFMSEPTKKYIKTLNL